MESNLSKLNANIKAKEASKVVVLDKTTGTSQVSHLVVSKSTLGKCQSLLASLKNSKTFTEQELETDDE